MAQSAVAQRDIPYTRMTTLDGLVDNNVRHIVQDDRGFLWLATLNGISRYDGYSFDNVRPNSDWRIRHLWLVPNGYFFAWTYSDHFLCYDMLKERFVSIPSQPRDAHYRGFLRHGGDVWLWGNRSGCLHLRMGGNRQLKSVPLNVESGSLPSDNVFFVGYGGRELAFISTDKGLFSYNGRKVSLVDASRTYSHVFAWGSTTIFVTTDGEVRLAPNLSQISSLVSLRNLDRRAELRGAFRLRNHLVLVSSRGCFRVNLRNGEAGRMEEIPGGGEFKIDVDEQENVYVQDEHGRVWMAEAYVDKKNNLVYNEPRLIVKGGESGHSAVVYSQFTRLRNGDIWMAVSHGGLAVVSEATGECSRVLSGIGLVKSIGCDVQDGLWVATELTGVAHIEADRSVAQRVWPLDDSPRSTIRSLRMLSDGSVAIGTRDGRLTLADSCLRSFHTVASEPTGVYCVLRDSKRRLWIGTRSNGLALVRENGSTSRFVHSEADTSSLSADAVYSIIEDRNGRVWLGTYGGGVNLVEEKDDGRVKFRRFFFDENLSGRSKVRCLIQDGLGRIWAGSNGGLVAYWPDSLIATPDAYRAFCTKSGDLLSDEVRCLYVDSKDDLWVGEAGAGIAVAECASHNTSFLHFGRADGLPNNMVQAFVEDSTGCIWVSTEYGVARVTPNRMSFGAFPIDSDPQHNVFSEGCALATGDGRVVLGGIDGLVAFDALASNRNAQDLRVAFTSLKVNGSAVTAASYPDDAVLESAISTVGKVKLRHYQNNVEISFSTFDLSGDQARLVRFSSQLQPYDADWSEPRSLPMVQYRNLPPGHYVLSVKACTSQGDWGPVSEIAIDIASPAWLSWWALSIYALVLAVVLVVGWRTFCKITDLNNRVRVEREMTELKLVFFTNISHEFRTPLTLIMGATEKLFSTPQLPNGANAHLSILEKSSRRMLSLVNQLLEFRKLEAGKLSLALQQTDVLPFLDGIGQMFSDVALQKNISFMHNVEAESFVAPLDQEKVEKMVFNLLSNAFKYTPDNGIVIMTTRHDKEHEVLCVEVRDSGVGIPPEKRVDLFERFATARVSQQSVGIGLNLTAELVKVHKGTVSYEPNPQGGSVFTISIPVGADAYSPDDFAQSSADASWDSASPDTSAQQEIAGPNADSEPITMPSGVDSHKMRILVVEDQDDIRAMIVAELSRLFSTIEARDGAEGLEKARTHLPDIVISDVMMPRMDGMEATRRLKSDPLTAHIPVIMLTALGSEQDSTRGIECGANIYVAKPFSPRLLLAHCRNVIMTREALSRRIAQEPGVVVHEETSVADVDPGAQFVMSLNGAIMKHIDDADLAVETLAQELSMSRTGFYSKVRSLTGYAPVEYVRVVRMKHAAHLLRKNVQASVAEVAYAAGFNDPFYFSRCFKQHFGVSPTAFRSADDNKNEV